MWCRAGAGGGRASIPEGAAMAEAPSWLWVVCLSFVFGVAERGGWPDGWLV